MKLRKVGLPYTIVINDVLYRKDISLGAKGLFDYLFSKPDGWDFSANRIINECKEGRKGILSLLQELELVGLLERQRLSNGKMDYRLKYDRIASVPEGDSGTEPQSLSGTQGLVSTSTSTGINTKSTKNIDILTFSSQGTEKVVKTLMEDIRTNQVSDTKNDEKKKKARVKKDRQTKKEEEEVYIKDRDTFFRNNEGIFETNRYVDDLLENKNKHINVIGYYFRVKGLTFSGFRQANAEFKRSLRIASEVAGYSHERIDATVEWIESQKYIDEWSLLTIAKHISNPRFNEK